MHLRSYVALLHKYQPLRGQVRSYVALLRLYQPCRRQTPCYTLGIAFSKASRAL